MKTWADLKVGDTVWMYEYDRRRILAYHAIPWNDPRRYSWRPTEIEHWLPHKVEGQTKLSWEIAGKKYPKRERPTSPLILLSEKEISDMLYVTTNKAALQKALGTVKDDPRNVEAIRLLVRAAINLGVMG